MTGVFRVRFPNTRRTAALARRSLMTHIAGFGYVERDLSDIETAVGEALANAAEHGHRPDSAIEVRIHSTGTQLVIEVQDDGGGFSASVSERSAPEDGSPRGFGIYLMRHLMDGVDYLAGGTCVRLTKQLPLERSDDVRFG